MQTASFPLARRQPATATTIGWLPWTVVERSHGTFVVSRESGGGTQRQFVKNSVGKPTIFRKRETADAACAKANGGAA